MILTFLTEMARQMGYRVADLGIGDMGSRPRDARTKKMKRGNLSYSTPLTLYSTNAISNISHTPKCYQINHNSFIIL